MATLVQFLAAGVNGAESGTAEFRLRGTTSSAEAFLYEQFEETSQPGTNILNLDENGALEIYCDVLCDVILRSSAGSILRTVTIGHSAPVIEVESASFTGTDYDGDPADTAGQPTTLQDVLDLWLDSAGATDWQVDVGGTPTNLSEAIASVTGLGINVQSPPYNAAGDGVTDDSAAIAAATTDAAGLPVLFPPGTYLCEDLSISAANVNWIGSGPGSTIIRGSGGSGAFLEFTDNTSGAWKVVSNLRINAATSYDRLIGLEGSQNVAFSNVDLDASNCTDGIEVVGSGSSKVFLSDFKLTLPNNSGKGLDIQSDDHFISINNGSVRIPSGFTGVVFEGAGMRVSNVTFDGSALNGACHFISAENSGSPGVYLGTFTGNTFIDGGSGSYAFDLTGIDDGTCFSESGNNFLGFVEPSGSADAGYIYELSYAAGALNYQVQLSSRHGRVAHLTHDDTDNFLANAALVAETVIVHLLNGAANPTYFINELGLPPGATARLIVSNESGTDNLQVGYYGAQTGAADFSRGGEIIEVDDDAAGAVIYQGVCITAGNPFAAVILAPDFAFNTTS